MIFTALLLPPMIVAAIRTITGKRDGAHLLLACRAYSCEFDYVETNPW